MTGKPARSALAVALVAQLALVVGLMSWCGWIAGVLLCLPLLLPLRGLLRRQPRSAVWSAYLMILYVAALLAEADALRQRHAVGVALASFALLAFVSLILFVRWSARDRALQTAIAARKATSGDASR